MALLILEAGDICDITDQMEAGPHAGETVELLSKRGSIWLVKEVNMLGEFYVEEKWLNLVRSV